MNRILSVCAAICCALLSACGNDEPAPAKNHEVSDAGDIPTEPQPIAMPANSEDDYRDMLVEKASRLAQSEMARMSAAELLYRNTPTLSEMDAEIVGYVGGAHAKMYRSFNSYQVSDIYRSESFLHPVTYEIQFNYDLLSTEARSTALPNAADLAITDNQFKVIARNTMSRHYAADADGEVLGTLPPLPPRPNFYTRDIDPTPTSIKAGAALAGQTAISGGFAQPGVAPPGMAGGSGVLLGPRPSQ